MLEEYIIQKEFISEEDAKKLIGIDNATIEAEMIYIVPEVLQTKATLANLFGSKEIGLESIEDIKMSDIISLIIATIRWADRY